MVFDTDDQAPFESLALDLDRLRVLQYQRLDRADVLIVPQCCHDNVVMQLVRHSGDHDLARRHALDHAAVKLGLRFGGFGFRERAEGVSGKSARDPFGFCQRLYRLAT